MLLTPAQYSYRGSARSRGPLSYMDRACGASPLSLILSPGGGEESGKGDARRVSLRRCNGLAHAKDFGAPRARCSPHGSLPDPPAATAARRQANGSAIPRRRPSPSPLPCNGLARARPAPSPAEGNPGFGCRSAGETLRFSARYLHPRITRRTSRVRTALSLQYAISNKLAERRMQPSWKAYTLSAARQSACYWRPSCAVSWRPALRRLPAQCYCACAIVDAGVP